MPIKPEQNFIARFQLGQMPDEMPEFNFNSNEAMPIAQVLKAANLVSSTSDAYRMLKQNAVRIDGERISDKALQLEPGSSSILQVGKRRLAKVTI